MFWTLLAFIAGGITVGVIANRRPQWFASITTLVNQLDDKAKAAIAQATSKPPAA